MSQDLVTLDSLRSYARGLDNRVKDKNKYTDGWVDSKINAAYELVATKRQPFINQEILDLTQYILDGTTEIEAEMDEDVAGWKNISYEIQNHKAEDPYWVGQIPRTSAVTWEVSPDNKVQITLEEGLDATKGYTMTFDYYFFPKTTSGDQFMSTDVYHMLRHAIASSVYDALRDYEKRDNFDNQLEYNSRTMTNGLDYNANGVVKGNWEFL